MSSALGEVTLPASVASGAPAVGHLAFRPHAVRLDDESNTEGLRLEGRVAAAEFLGEFMRYEISVNQAIVTADLPHVRGTDRIPEGTLLRLRVPSGELRLMPRAPVSG